MMTHDDDDDDYYYTYYVLTYTLSYLTWNSTAPSESKSIMACIIPPVCAVGNTELSMG